MNKTVIIGMIALSSWAVCGGAGAGEYWPLWEDATYIYEDGAGNVMRVEYDGSGGRECYLETGGEWYYLYSENYVVDEAGDTFLVGSLGYSRGGIDPDYYYGFEPALSIVDLPLEIGKLWETAGYSPCCYGPCVAQLSFTVLGECQLTVPAGTFAVTMVSMTNSMQCLQFPGSGTFALNRELGPITLPGGYQLVEVTGGVATESRAWGDIKSLYR